MKCDLMCTIQYCTELRSGFQVTKHCKTVWRKRLWVRLKWKVNKPTEIMMMLLYDKVRLRLVGFWDSWVRSFVAMSIFVIFTLLVLLASPFLYPPTPRAQSLSLPRSRIARIFAFRHYVLFRSTPIDFFTAKHVSTSASVCVRACVVLRNNLPSC